MAANNYMVANKYIILAIGKREEENLLHPAFVEHEEFSSW